MLACCGVALEENFGYVVLYVSLSTTTVLIVKGDDGGTISQKT